MHLNECDTGSVELTRVLGSMYNMTECVLNFS